MSKIIEQSDVPVESHSVPKPLPVFSSQAGLWSLIGAH